MERSEDRNDIDDIRKSVADFIFEDLHRRGILIGEARYDISTIPAWFFFGANDDEFVERTFRVILNRPPSLTDIQGVKASLTAGLSRAQYLISVANSPEAALANRPTDHIIALASAELTSQEAQASAQLERQEAVKLASRTPIAKILSKLKSSLKACFADQGRARLDSSISGTSADRLSLIERELQTLREGLNDVLRTTHCYPEGELTLIRSRQSKSELPAAVNWEELKLVKERILTEIDHRYRGTELKLKAQLEFYLPYIREISELGTVIDVGCGRGTFLEIMRDNQIDAIGLEINENQIENCRRKNLDVRLTDALEFMRRSEADQYGAITFFHVIEHLDFETLVAILMEAYRVVAPGGIVLMETPNAENLYVSTHMFNVDPTHIKPITYQYISTVLEVLGFECERLPVRALFHDDDGGETGNRHLNYLLSVSANLSVIVRKPLYDS
jgi:2-polyprenyl-3-methyl-5-hydroxy-6-metoxy-1,4-benzoquinol methylase